MSLSPYINPANLNGSLQSSGKIGEALYGNSEYGALDKRNLEFKEYNDGRFSIATGGIYNAASQAISSIKDISDTIENALGSRPPMYKIGEIDSLEDKDWSKYIPNAVKGLVRAVTDFKNKTQEGVIIDGIGDANGEFSVEFTSNPVLFRGSQIVDNRYRKPSSLRMTVMVSNYLNDDMSGTIADALAGLDPTGLVAEAKNLLGYGGNTRAQYALYKLRWLMENAQPFNVYTPHGVYENMVIKTISPQTNSNTMDMLYCDIEFQELILYAPYTEEFGKMPARMSTKAGIREGWTQIASEKTTEMLGA